MSSEMPVSARDAELRRMLVATATAAPVQPKRRWSFLAPIGAFALAGALTGAVSAAALAAPDDHPPVTVDHLMDVLVQRETQLFGEPLVIEDEGSTVESLGAQPAGAVEVTVAFHCKDPGTYNLVLDDQPAMTIACDAASAAASIGGGIFSVKAAPEHTLAVSAEDGDRYIAWASWTAPPVPEDPSPEQVAVMADGEVSEEEYRAQFDRYADCMVAAGYPVDAINTSGTIITYVNSGASVTSGAEGRCYAQEFAQVDRTWQGSNQ